MKKILAVSFACVLACLPLSVFAAPNPNLQLQIFPLECSFDTVDLGHVTSLGLTPEDCYPKPPGPSDPTPNPSQPLPSAPSPFFPSGSGPIFLQNPIPPITTQNLPSSNLKEPLIVDTREVEKEKSADQQQTSAIVISVAVLAGAGLLAAAHAVYTGIVGPLIAQGNIPKPRFPWSKK